MLDNSSRGVWILTPKGQKTDRVDKEEVKRWVVEHDRTKRESQPENLQDQEEIDEMTWQDDALEALKNMSPEAFERLCQRLLRESGFIKVEVTRRSGDGGIDGRGVVKTR